VLAASWRPETRRRKLIGRWTPSPPPLGKKHYRRAQPGAAHTEGRRGEVAQPAPLGRKRRSEVCPKRTRVVTLYTDPPPNSTTICLDELGPVSPRTYPPAPGWSPDGHRIKAPLEYGRGPEKVWVYGALRGYATARRSRSPRPLAQHQRLPAATRSRRADESERRPLPDHRQPLQPQEPTYPAIAGEASASEAGLHSSGGVLAQPPRSVVATVQTRGFGRTELRRRARDRVGHEGRHKTAQPPGETVGLGSSTEAPTASAAFLCLPSLRNGALR
jgi:hypothetical protein